MVQSLRALLRAFRTTGAEPVVSCAVGRADVAFQNSFSVALAHPKMSDGRSRGPRDSFVHALYCCLAETSVERMQ